MRKFKVHSSERTSRKIIVSLACVYHYCSCLRLPLLPEPNLNTTGFLSNQWNTVFFPATFCFTPCLFPCAYFFFGHLRCLFILFYFVFFFFVSAIPLHALKTHVGIHTENFSKDIETIASKEREPGTQGVRETSYLLGIVLDCLTLLNANKKFQNETYDPSVVKSILYLHVHISVHA